MDQAASFVLFGFTIILHLAEGQHSIVGEFFSLFMWALEWCCENPALE